MTTPSRPAPALRIGDAERTEAADRLASHHSAGRLDLDEFDQRTVAAFAARTRADLDTLFADLPAPVPHDQRPDGPPPRRPAPGLDVGLLVHLAVYVSVVVGLWVLWVATGGGHPWPVYPMLGWGSGVAGHAAATRYCTS